MLIPRIGIIFPLIIFTSLLVSSSPSSSISNYCKTELDCTGNFQTCRDNLCVCDDEDLQETLTLVGNNSTFSECRGISAIGSFCNNSTYLCPSPPSSYCEESTHKCQCSKGYELDPHANQCRKGFGESCNDHVDLCNVEKYLECSTNGVCVCSKSLDPGVTWDGEDLKKCVAPLRGTCELKVWMGLQLQCGKNAECRKSSTGNGTTSLHEEEYYGECQCKEGFYPDPLKNYKCVPIYGKLCNSTEDCGESETYTCSKTRGTCDCKEGTVYSQGAGCRLKVGEQCNLRQDSCVNYASCEEPLEGSPLRCQCLDEFVPTKSGLCQLPYASKNCTSQEGQTPLCHEEAGLTCQDDECLCSRMHHIFDPSQGQCVGVDYASCNPEVEGPKCVQNAECKAQDPQHSYCVCKPTFSIYENRTCYYGFGTDCQLLPNHVDGCLTSGLGLTCNPSASKCSCATLGKLYDDSVGKCLLKIGQPCNNNYEDGRCIRKGFCGTGDKCQCYTGYAPTPGGDCLVDYGYPCDDDDNQEEEEESGVSSVFRRCNGFQGLKCQDGECKCGVKDHEFNETLGKCGVRRPLDDESHDSGFQSDMEIIGVLNSTGIGGPSSNSEGSPSVVPTPTISKSAECGQFLCVTSALVFIISSGVFVGSCLMVFVGVWKFTRFKKRKRKGHVRVPVQYE